MTRFETWLGRRKIVLMTLVGVIVCLVLFDDLEDRLGRPILDVQNGYTIESVREDMLGYGPEGRAHYALMAVTLDFVFPAFYGGFLGALIILSLPDGNNLHRGGRATRMDIWRRRLLLLPLLSVMVDLAENIQIFAMLRQFPDITASQVALADLTTRSKFLVLNVTFIVVFVVVAVQSVRALRRA